MAKYYMMTLSPFIAVIAGAVINNKTIFSPAIILFCILLIFWTLVEAKGVYKKDISPDETNWVTKASRAVWLIAVFISSKDYHSKNNIYPYAQITGFLLFSAGIYIRFISMKELKNSFSYSLKIGENHKLISSGIYKYLRHPSYSGMIMLSCAIPLIFTSPTGFILISSVPIYHILLRIKFEEKILVDQLEEEYLNYIKMTKKLIPYIY